MKKIQRIKQKLAKCFNNVILLGVVLLVGFTIAEEIEKQLPKEFKINYKRIILEALIFALILGGATYLFLKLGGLC